MAVIHPMPPTTTTAILLLLFLFPVAISDSTIDHGCIGRRIHIRRLPPCFNLHLLSNCSAYPLFHDFCPHLANHGLGHLTHNRSRSWYRTYPFMLELIFHRRMLDYPCLVSNPAHADAIFLPYYAAVDSLRYLYGADVNSSANHGLHLYRFLQHDSPEVWRRRHGHDHFLVMARPAWDFSQTPSSNLPIWGTSFLEIPEFFNVTALTLEGRAWPWQEQAVPYPTSFHPPSTAFLESWIHRVRRSRRQKLVMFAGGGGVSSGTANIRRSIRKECDDRRDLCQIVDCSNEVCEGDPIRYMRPMLESVFCLQPPGDTPTRRSTFDAMLAGCVPVFFEELSAREQYQWHLPRSDYPEFSVFIPKEDVVFKGLGILETLLAVPEDKVKRMREKVVELMPRIMYRRHGRSAWSPEKVDAFDIAVEGTLLKIKSRINHSSTYGF